MSAGLMSCVRENSPRLEYEDDMMNGTQNGGGPQSLPSTVATAHDNHVAENFSDKSNVMSSTNVDGSTDGGRRESAPNAEQQKRRRFHPLRNLRRIFRRRTINSATTTDATKTTTTGEAQTRTLPVTRCSGGGVCGGKQQQQHSSNSEKNLRSATTLTSMSSVTSASSPSSPLTHQQLQETYHSQSLPKSKTYGNSTQLQRDVLLIGSNNNATSRHHQIRQKLHQTLQHDSNAETSTDTDDITTIDDEQNRSGEMYAATTTTVNNSSAYHQHHQHQHHQHHQQFQQRLSQSIGVAVLPPIGVGNRSRNFFTERQKLRSVDDSTNDLDSSENDSAGPSGGGGGIRRLDGRGNSNSGDITDSQRSLSEGRLVDSDYTREGLSQSHDSVFSESATASSLSIVLRAELADVLRKRRTRPDGSDEDLGLPRSPGSPQRRAIPLGQSARPPSTTNANAANIANQSQVSSMSLLSMNSNECDDFQATSTANNSMIEQHQSTTQTTRYVRSATFSSMPNEILRHPATMSMSFLETTTAKRDEVDDVFSGGGTECQRLSHAAAKHKMAIRPVKKNVPSRQHRRTLERAIPEANEDSKTNQFGYTNKKLQDTLNNDVKSKSKSLPPGVNAAKLMEQQQHANDELSKSTSTFTNKTKNTFNNTSIIEVSKSTTTVTTASSNTLVNSKTSSSKSNSDSETFTSSTKISNSNTTSQAAAASSSSGNTTKMFGFIGAKENSNNKTTTMDKEKEKMSETSSSTSVLIENSESGFLRRLMQRNSKRNYAKANPNADVADETDLKNIASEPKKMPISTSCIEMPILNSLTAFAEAAAIEKVKSAMSHEEKVEITRKGIQREIKHEGQNGLSAILNNFTAAVQQATTTQQSMQPMQPTTSTSITVGKPKSGAAARQRYVPQEIAIPQQESFQSTSIVRDIGKTTTTTSPTTTTQQHHHFEKKPKIVGLSAFQQKISRSNDSVVRLSASNNSLETSTDDLFYCDNDANVIARQRKTVEKSRSFRTYNEAAHEESSISSTVSSRHNMPSLPDLSVNLRVPNYTQSFMLNSSYQQQQYQQHQQQFDTSPDDNNKCASLGFEINDNSLLKPRNAESFGNLNPTTTTTTAGSTTSPYKRNLIVTTNTIGGSNVMPQLSPSNSCSQQTNISEIEQNIDMIVKSPFISVIRKSANFEQIHDIEQQLEKPPIIESCETNKKLPQVEVFERTKTTLTELKKQQQQQKTTTEQKRPKSLVLKTKSEEQLATTSASTTPTTPTTASVPLRTRLKSCDEVKTTTPKEEPRTLKPKENERKSAPVVSAVSNNTANSLKFTKRSSSMNEPSCSEEAQQTQTPTQASMQSGNVPEFMKIQLNHVEKARFLANSNVVLAKNLKESKDTVTPPQLPPPVEKSLYKNGSNESVVITERPTRREESSTPPKPSCNMAEKRFSDFLPKSPTKKVAKSPTRTPTAVAVTLPQLADDELILLRSKTTDNKHTTEAAPTPTPPPTAATNKLSIHERKRLFMTDATTAVVEKPQTAIKKIEEVRNERKKSMSEEVFRKLSTCGRLQEQQQQKFTPTAEETTTTKTATIPPMTTSPPISPTKVSPLGTTSLNNTQPNSPINESNVILRKKSFASNNNNNNNNNSNSVHKDDSTPELMKVFARRSLKVKDEDIAALTDKIHEKSIKTNTTTNAPIPKCHFVDSDKENQSSSEEKLNKLAVDLEEMTSVTKITNHKLQTTSTTGKGTVTGTITGTAATNNRNSVADFRQNSLTTNTTTAKSNNNNNYNQQQLPSMIRTTTNNGFKASFTNGITNATEHHIHQQQQQHHHHRSLTNGNSKLETKNQTKTDENYNNNNNNTNNNNININNVTKRTHERQSLNILKSKMESSLTTTTSSNNSTNAVEKSQGTFSTTKQQQSQPQSQQQKQIASSTTTNNLFHSDRVYTPKRPSNPSGLEPMDRITDNSRVATTTTTNNNKPIERSATVSEFKGIHQRRAEWEQRAKEALK